MFMFGHQNKCTHWGKLKCWCENDSSIKCAILRRHMSFTTISPLYQIVSFCFCVEFRSTSLHSHKSDVYVGICFGDTCRNQCSICEHTHNLLKTNECLFTFIAAMKPLEVQEKLGLTRIRDRNWYVQPSCATSGDGLCEGLTWLTSNHKLWD